MLMLNRNGFFIKRILTRSVSKTTKISASTPKPVADEQSEIENSATNGTKFPAKLPETQPLVKGFFLGEVNPEHILYPEILERIDLEKFDENNQIIANYVQNALNKNGKTSIQVDKTVMEDLKRMNLFKNSVSHKYGGTCDTLTESLVAQEYKALDPNLALVTASHQIACNVIEEYGNEDQKLKYLPKLGNGDLIATLCMFEEGNIQHSTMSTKADQDHESDEWSINGTKHAVINAENSNLFVVLAQTRAPDVVGDMGDTITAFLIDRSTPGITVSERDNTIGCNGVYQSKVIFDQVPVTNENILFEFGRGQEIGSKILLNFRLHLSLINVVQLKQILEYFSEYCVETEDKLKKLYLSLAKAPQAVQLRDSIAKATCSVYAIESMLYLIAGIVDTYENPDITVETCILKIYSQEQLANFAEIMLNFMDQSITMKGHPLEQYLRDIIQLQTYGEPKDALKLFVGIAGIQHVGQSAYEDIKKRRNPLFNPAFITKLLFQGSNVYKINENLNLKENVHQGFDPFVKRLEESIIRIRIATRNTITRHGRDIVEKQCDILRLSEAAVQCFAMFSVISRASRAVCLQLPEAGNEHLIANCFTQTGGFKVQKIIEDLENGPYYTYDDYYGIVAKMLIRTKKYFPAHPLTRFF